MVSFFHVMKQKDKHRIDRDRANSPVCPKYESGTWGQYLIVSGVGEQETLFCPGNGGYMWFVFLFLIGFGLSVTGGVTIIAYLNFLPAGLSYSELFSFIVTRIECYFFPIGIFIMLFVLYLYPNQS